jgi:Ca2+-binding EF-hand superfamily protein
LRDVSCSTAGDDSEIGFFEFQKALQWMHVVHLSAPDTLRLFQHFDTHSSGRVDYKEFLIALRYTPQLFHSSLALE